jgi:hypothetical protein
MGPDAFRLASAAVDAAAIGAGRDPAGIRRIYNFGGRITDEPAGDDPLVGPRDRWIETLTGWAIDPGVDSFVFWPDETTPEQVERFAADVVPAVREAVATARR